MASTSKGKPVRSALSKFCDEDDDVGEPPATEIVEPAVTDAQPSVPAILFVADPDSAERPVCGCLPS